MKPNLKLLNRKTGKKVSEGGVHPVNISGNLTNNQQMIARSFNNYFLTVANKSIDNSRNDKIGQSNNPNNPLNYTLQIFKHPFPNMKSNYA